VFLKSHLPILLTTVLVMLYAGSCTKYEKKGIIEKSGIALTFDDYSIDNWYQYLPLFDSFGVRATFYISQYHKLSTEQKNKMRKMQSHGHEIAFHTSNHYNMVNYLDNFQIRDLIEREIYEDLRKMNHEGFYPRTFAYPYGSHNDYLDKELCKIFKSVRALNGTNNYAKSFTRGLNNKVLYAIGIDNKRPRLDKIEFLIEEAYHNSNCLILVGHNIEKPDAAFQVSLEKLKAILQKAKALNMRFYTVSEISL